MIHFSLFCTKEKEILACIFYIHIYIYTHIHTVYIISTSVLLLDTAQSIVMILLLDPPLINMFNSRRMRLSILKLLSAGVEVEKVISHRQLVAKLSNLQQNRKFNF